jgi:hypothetical protein
MPRNGKLLSSVVHHKKLARRDAASRVVVHHDASHHDASLNCNVLIVTPLQGLASHQLARLDPSARKLTSMDTQWSG